MSLEKYLMWPATKLRGIPKDASYSKQNYLYLYTVCTNCLERILHTVRTQCLGESGGQVIFHFLSIVYSSVSQLPGRKKC